MFAGHGNMFRKYNNRLTNWWSTVQTVQNKDNCKTNKKYKKYICVEFLFTKCFVIACTYAKTQPKPNQLQVDRSCTIMFGVCVSFSIFSLCTVLTVCTSSTNPRHPDLVGSPFGIWADDRSSWLLSGSWRKIFSLSVSKRWNISQNLQKLEAQQF
jgi:hypothetical protein